MEAKVCSRGFSSTFTSNDSYCPWFEDPNLLKGRGPVGLFLPISGLKVSRSVSREPIDLIFQEMFKYLVEGANGVIGLFARPDSCGLWVEKGCFFNAPFFDAMMKILCLVCG